VCLPEHARWTSNLRATAREALKAGKIPNRKPDRTWVGPGVNVACSICGLPGDALASAVSEIQFARDGDNPGLDVFHVHIRCFAAWEFERDQDGTA
jgi:hypothetical protein